MVPSLLGHINRTSMHTLFMNILHRIMNIGNITFEKDKKTNIMEIRKKKETQQKQHFKDRYRKKFICNSTEFSYRTCGVRNEKYWLKM